MSEFVSWLRLGYLLQPMGCLHLSRSRQSKGRARTAPGKRRSQRKNERENRRQEDFFFFPFPFFYSSCALPVSVKAAGNCYRQIECLPVSVSGSFADSMNHAKEGSGKRRREQENDQFSRALALSLIWSGSLGFNSMSQSGLETHTFVITFQEEGAGRCEFSGVIKRGRPGIISRSRDCLALALRSTPDTWMLSVETDRYLLLHRSKWEQRHVGGGFVSRLALPSWLRAGRDHKGIKTCQHKVPLLFGSRSDQSSEIIGIPFILPRVPLVGLEAVSIWV